MLKAPQTHPGTHPSGLSAARYLGVGGDKRSSKAGKGEAPESSKTDMVWPLAKAKRVRNTFWDKAGQGAIEQGVRAVPAEGAARPLEHEVV